MAPSAAADDGSWDEVVDHAHALLAVDGFDERAHEVLVHGLRSAGRHGEAGVAVDRYRAAMADLGVQPREL